MKIYTRTGDAGHTHLIGGKSVSKAALRVEAYGTVDELNSVLGVALTAIGDADVRVALEHVQAELFDLGAELASPGFVRDESPGSRQAAVTEEQVTRMEAGIDAASAECPELRYFVIPGGTPAAAHLHVARTVARRAERCLVRLSEDAAEPAIRPLAIRYLNRLSDLLFALARLVNHRAGVADVEWRPPSGRPVFHIR